MAAQTISYPFTVDPVTHRVAVVDSADLSKIWKDRVLQVVGTNVGERVMRPLFGTALDRYLLDSETLAETDLADVIALALTTFLPAIKINDVSLIVSEDRSSIEVRVDYRIPGQQPGDTQLVTGSIGLDGTFTNVGPQ